MEVYCTLSEILLLLTYNFIFNTNDYEKYPFEM